MRGANRAMGAMAERAIAGVAQALESGCATRLVSQRSRVRADVSSMRKASKTQVPMRVHVCRAAQQLLAWTANHLDETVEEETVA